MSSYHKYLLERTHQVKALLQQIEQKKSNARAFQSLPRHLRRRTMSTNAYRVPLHIRQRARSEMEKSAKGGPSESGSFIRAKKVVHRKAKRRPPYIQKDFVRRQRVNKWLETHIWHAKRMFMTNIWRYRLAVKPTAKGRRSVIRASNSLSTVCDRSYMVCLEITGSESSIAALFKTMTPPDSLSVNSRTYINGDREGSIDLYYPNRYPFHFICPSQFHWKPSTTNEKEQVEENESRQLWLWIHPSSILDIQSILQNQSKEHKISIKSLQDKLQRFELTGAKCNSALHSVLVPIDIDGNNNNNNNSMKGAHSLWNSLKQLRSTATLPTSVILGLTVLDPRLVCHVPESIAQCVDSVAKPPLSKEEQQKATITQQEINRLIVNWSSQKVSYSPIYEESKRLEMSKNIEKVSSVYQRRKNPFAIKNNTNNYSTPSILLIQRDGGLSRGYGSGFDIIIPEGWGQAFWLSLVYSGSWAIGLQNRDEMLLEQGIPSYPRDYPDSNAYKEYHQAIENDKLEKYKRTPSGKRPNYIHNQVYFPFNPNWNWILDLDNQDNESFYQQLNNDKDEEVLIKKEKLQQQETSVTLENQKKKTKLTKTDTTPKKAEEEEFIKHTINKASPYFVYRGKSALSILNLKLPSIMKNYDSKIKKDLYKRGLVRVSVKMLYGGRPVMNSVIYAPNQKDLEYQKKCEFFRHSPSPPLEYKDANDIPSNEIELKENSTRTPIGYIVSGDQSLIRGVGQGIGYCSAYSFIRLEKNAINVNLSPIGFAFVQIPTSSTLYPVILTIQP
ncbi:RNase P protein subunit [Cavenderia fasciculata]|uniref:RNase P protein subunit n=1 Tax=Cavenderia fasciculata TaxID=261658 RepID=F4Q1W8_CACFS|nr:RNase P protein subunit [Cavenderia fasciculata]EGG17988.1 RNase P protein subunit [Cavenderia fasciculata]|eukprot:XP_004356880.1 RNase P protein subunit [Cavenderia fasciculata]